MRDPEMGQLDSPWPTYGGSANYTRGLSVTVWPLHMGEAPVNDDQISSIQDEGQKNCKVQRWPGRVLKIFKEKITKNAVLFRSI